MNISIKSGFPRLGKQALALVLSLGLLSVTGPQYLFAFADQQQNAPPPPGAPPQGGQPPYMQQTPEQMQELVAPIALYPDSLVSQILAASTYPEQVVQADRWLQANPNLKAEALAKAADQQPWDPSVKALTAFPAVLGNMDKNLSWTSSLGDAYYNQQQAVMDAVQVMRNKAQQAGTLKSTQQETVTTQGPNVVIQPADPQVVYVPQYDPWLVYGYPLDPWPGWYEYPGIWYGGPYISWGIGFPIGFFFGYGWGWSHWGFDWGHRWAVFNGGRYFSRSTTFFNRNGFYARGGVPRNNVVGSRAGGAFAGRGGANTENRGAAAGRPFNGNTQAARGFAAPGGQTGMRSGAFSGFGSGGETRGFASRGSSSFGSGGARGGGFGGGGARAGGGGGAAHGGGGRR